MLAVEIAGKVEEIGFEHGLVRLEHRHWPDTKICDPVVARNRLVVLHNHRADRVNAEGRFQALDETHVRGWKSNGASARGALLDARLHCPPMTEELGGLFGFSLLQRIPDARRRDFV